MLKLLIGMAIEDYRYDPRARRGSAVVDIVHDLEKRGVPLSDDTVRKYYLEQGAALLPPEGQLGAACVAPSQRAPALPRK